MTAKQVAEIRWLWNEVKQKTTQDIRQLRIDSRSRFPVHFLEYRAFEPQWQPRLWALTAEEAINLLTHYLSFAEALA